MQNPPFFSFLVLRLVQLSVKYGACSHSAIGFAAYGFFLSGSANDIEGASNYGRLSIRLVEKFQAKEHTAKVHALVYGGIKPWVEILRASLKPLKDAHEIGMRCGDIQYALLCAMQYCSHAYQSGKKLETLESKMKKHSDMMQEYKQISTCNLVRVMRQAALNMMGRSKDPLILTGEAMDQEHLLKNAIERKHRNLELLIYLHCSWLAYFFGSYELASQMAGHAQAIIHETCSATFSVCNHAFFNGLISLALLRKTGDTKWKSIANESIEKMENWTKYAPENCQHKLFLLQAESAFFLGQDANAAKHYEMAIDGAKENKFIQDQALSCERAGIFYLAHGNVSKASEYYGQAHDIYLQWGAKGKADHIRINFPF
mmetsp:Transcript_27698/g.35378  ORF Transcript_27698/g.35378 Transcript_27698/m.35378 type:complete len:373 (+) Transcript_27698:203-1321(+)